MPDKIKVLSYAVSDTRLLNKDIKSRDWKIKYDVKLLIRSIKNHLQISFLILKKLR